MKRDRTKTKKESSKKRGRKGGHGIQGSDWCYTLFLAGIKRKAGSF